MTSLFCVLIVFFAIYIITNLNKITIGTLSIAIGILSFVLIGRKIIVRHIIREDFNITVEYLLRPNYKQNYTKTDIKNVIFKTIDYGRYGLYEKGIIIFKNQKNHHKDYLTYDIEDVPKWFWSNFNYPNELNKNSR